jgi:hypothetical protein
MKNLLFLICLVLPFFNVACKFQASPLLALHDTVLISDTIQYHPVRINIADNSILPWFSSDQGESYDTVLMLVWDFWKNMETDSNGLKYYMNHQVWKPEHDMRGLGGDQINMALSSWSLLYAYTGDKSIIDDMVYMADTYLERSLADSSDKWPFLPYPYNTVIHSGIYDGDMRNGKGYLQPDKAGNFGYELINLYKITGQKKYLDAAVLIAQTLVANMKQGNSDRSPWYFRVNAKTGKPGFFFNNNPDNFFDNNQEGKKITEALYTANWTGTLLLFEELMKFDTPNRSAYESSFQNLLTWMKDYPLKTNKWGPFFEDIPGWSDTQTNAITFAMFILQHQQLFTDWKSDVKGIIDWTYDVLGNHEYEKYGVVVMNEQTVYQVPGNSHSSRQASVELLYAQLSGDSSYTDNAIRTLNWATYTVADDGRNRYIRDDVWLTDGYGDYVRHYLRAMSTCPELAPIHKNRLLGSSSVISSIVYSDKDISYHTYDNKSSEILRLKRKPSLISVNGQNITEAESTGSQGWKWTHLQQGGGVLHINKEYTDVVITF